MEVGPGKVIRRLSREETETLRQQWLSTFCKRKQGVNTNAYLWHIFSYGRFEALSGSEAERAYAQQLAPEYIVLSNYHELAVETHTRPKECSVSDYYVFPRNMAWTMAFTHEDGWLGPYFAEHPNQEALKRENERKMQKQREITNAKKRGWM